MSEKKRRPPKASGFSAGNATPDRSVSQEGQKRTFKSAPTPAPKPEDANVSREVTGEDKYREIPARLIRRWDLKDRTEAELLDDPKYAELIVEVKAEGVISPVTVRPLREPDEHGHLFEGIVGFKRISAAKFHDIDVPAHVRDLSDVEALRIQKSENKGRSGPSVWALGNHYLEVVESGKIKGSNREIAEAIGVDRTQFANYIRIAREIPKDVSDNIKLHLLGYNSLRDMAALIQSKAGNAQEAIIDRIVEHADEFNERPEKASTIIGKITRSLEATTKKGANSSGGVYRSQKGKTYTVKPGNGKVTFTMHQGALEVATEEELTSVINDFLAKKGLKIEKVEKN